MSGKATVYGKILQMADISVTGEAGHNDDSETDLCKKVPESSYRNGRKNSSRIDKNREIMDNNSRPLFGAAEIF